MRDSIDTDWGSRRREGWGGEGDVDRLLVKYFRVRARYTRAAGFRNHFTRLMCTLDSAEVSSMTKLR